MSIQKKNALWFTLYGIFITVVFLYLFFPSDIVKSRLEEAVTSSDIILKSGSLKPSLPLGVKLKDITISSASSGNSPFQGDLLDLQFNPLSIFQKNKSIGFSGRAYGGKFNGSLELASFSNVYPPREGDLNLQNVDLSKYTFLKTMIGRDISGKAKGSLIYSSTNKAGNSSGIIDLVLTKGTYPLLEQFLGMNRVDFDIVEIKVRLLSSGLKLEKFAVSSPQIRCSFKGDITLADIFKNSQLKLNGEMELLGQNKAKMNVNIGGTIANPDLRYI